MDRLRMKNQKLSDLEEEQGLKNDTLQRKAMMQLQENEEEIKRLNQVRTHNGKQWKRKIQRGANFFFLGGGEIHHSVLAVCALYRR